MKVSILKESLCIGGTERAVSNISTALSGKHNVVTVLYSGDDMVYGYGGKLLDMHLPYQKSKVKKILNNIKRVMCYRKHLREFNPDISFQFVSFRSYIGKFKLKNSVKIISSRDFSVLSDNIVAHKKNLDISDAMICNSNYLRDYFIEKYPEDKERVFTVYNIIDTNLIKKQAEEETDCDFLEFRKKCSQIIVSTGRFCKEKAFENLIEAFAECKKTMSETGLVLIGDGDYKGRYLEKINELGISDSVYFTGYQNNPYKYMAKCDVFVLSSLSEGFPNVLAEAMALSLPVISVNCLTGPAEILMEEYDYNIADENFVECKYGILTPHYDVKGTEYAVKVMSDAIIHMLSDEKLMQKYGAFSVERAADFSASSAVEKLEEIFEILVSRKRDYQR